MSKAIMTSTLQEVSEASLVMTRVNNALKGRFKRWKIISQATLRFKADFQLLETNNIGDIIKKILTESVNNSLLHSLIPNAIYIAY